MLAAADAEEARQLEQNYQGNIHLLLSDVVMPGMNGPEYATGFLQRNPRAEVIFMSGYTHGELDIQNSPSAAMIEKPFNRHRLLKTIDSVLRQNYSNSRNDAGST